MVEAVEVAAVEVAERRPCPVAIHIRGTYDPTFAFVACNEADRTAAVDSGVAGIAAERRLQLIATAIDPSRTDLTCS